MSFDLTLFLAELKQRKVIRALVAYGAAVFAILQGADLLFAVLLLPDVAFTFLALACLAGFPIVAVLSWVLELTVHGLRRAQDVPDEIRRQRVPLKRYLELVGALALAGILISVTAGAVGRITYPASSHDGRVGLAVFPFRSLGDTGPEWSEGAADLLATALDGTPGLRIVDPWPLWRKLREEPNAPAATPEPSDADRLTGDAGAQRFLLGSVVPSGDSVEVVLRLYQIGRSEPIRVFSVDAAEDGLGAAVREAAVLTLSRVWGPLRPRDLPRELDYHATQSPEALKAYLAAKEALRRGLVDSANVAIDQAISTDSTFALALVEAVSIKSWLLAAQGQPFAGFWELLDRVEPLEATLNERTRLRLEATRAALRTDGAGAIRAAQRILEIDPLDYAASTKLEYYYQVLGWQLGPPRPGGREGAERVVLMDSTQVPALVVRAWWAVALGDTADQRAQLRRLRRLGAESPLARGEILALRGVLARGEELEVFLSSLPTTLPELSPVIRSLRVADPSRYERLLDRLLQLQNPVLTGVAQNEGMRLDVSRGRLQEVDSAIQAASPSGGGFALLARRFVIAADLAGVGDTEVAGKAAAEFLAQVPPESALDLAQTREVWWDTWLMGAWNAQRGDTAVARRAIRAIGTFPPGGTSEDYRGSLQADIEARLAVRRGDLSVALDRARSAFSLWTIHTDNLSEHHPEPGLRLNLALLYRDTGMADSARAVLSSFVPPTTWMGFLTARASFELGEIAFAGGRMDDAARHYQRALRFWDGGGAAIASLRDRARSRLASLD